MITEEQIEILRHQIAIYGGISEQLADMYRVLLIRREESEVWDPTAETIPVRGRWTPTATQLSVLEGVFERGEGTPSKQKIREITSALTLHGDVSEKNVYNWFQNRRARSKRKAEVPLG
ncbi:WUSCHEL-related homeobox 8-like [Wolffia australiana]